MSFFKPKVDIKGISLVIRYIITMIEKSIWFKHRKSRKQAVLF